MQLLIFYGQAKFRRNRFDAYVRTQKALAHVCNEVVGLHPTVIAHGDGDFAAVRRGRRGAPTKMMRRALARAARASGGFLVLVLENR